MTTPRSCLALVSGGLDSLLALRLVVEQGIPVTAFHALQVFAGRRTFEEERSAIREACLSIGAADVVFRDTSEAMVALTKEPRYGYGKNLNACLDCRLLTIGTAVGVMRDIGADFLVSGEVIGQRPKSQLKQGFAVVNRALRDMGVEGLLVRPLCAKCLEPTLPETEGWIDRNRLEAISGRGRHRQMELAAQWSIPYPNPAGGCLVTDVHYCNRLRYLMEHAPDWNAHDAAWLKFGHPFHVAPDAWLTVSRSGKEEERLLPLITGSDWMYRTEGKPGALVVLRGRRTDRADGVAKGLAVWYSKCRADGQGTVAVWQQNGSGSLCPEVPVLEPGDAAVYLAETAAQPRTRHVPSRH